MPEHLIEPLETPKILLIDDDPDNLFALEKILANPQLIIFKASSGREAVNLAKSHEFALILLDVHMAGIDGFKTAELIRYFGKSKYSPIIFLTAAAITQQNVFQGYEVGAVDYLFKPPNPRVLQSKVKVFVELYQQKMLIDAQKKKLEDSLESQRRIAEDLKTAQQNAEKANEAKSVFLANISHEIRTPLGAILGFTQVLLNKSKHLALPEDFQIFQQNIHTSAQNLMVMINNFLDISKIEAGKMELVEEDFHVKSLVKNIFEVHEILASQKGVFLSHEIHPELPSAIRTDRTKLIQILTNLLGNAIKFTPEGKEVKLKVMGNEDEVAFLVIDQGIGIPKDRQQAIFKAYEQVDDSTTRNFGGTGLGLAITQKMVEILGGRISVASRGVNQGSNFSVRIPYQAPSSPVESPEEIKHDELQFSKDNHILVVEDNLMNQNLIRALFEEVELEVEFADNGKLGLDRLQELKSQEKHPDLIFMDIQMPVMDGMTAIKEIRKDPYFQEIAIVALSADAFIEQQQKAFAVGANDYLTKPIDPNHLTIVLDKYLNTKV
ncbi:MAG: response regulator [SAR324 cluster bacterium]|nr:response regulator [SAR324 cluster bacterium]